MLFNEILKEKYEKLSPIFDELFDFALKNQTHSGDLLLVMENGLLKDEKDPNDPTKYKLYYNLGPSMDYHCETANHDFIKDYIKSVVTMNYCDYQALHQYTPERSNEISELQNGESLTIQIEMLIYLKIWEGETFLKKMYQISRLINGEDYDWHLTIGFGKNKVEGSLERFQIIEKLKKNLKTGLPKLYEVLKYNHRSQLRNAIAHSQYAMIGRNIWLNNYVDGKDGHQSGISFDEWVDLFHETLTIYTLYEMLIDKIREYYYQTTKLFKLKKEVRVSRHFPEIRTFLIVLYSREFFKDWSPYPLS